MKKYLLMYPAILLVLFVFLAAMPIAGEEAIYSDVIRLHVIAASDGDADQAAKLSVRDAILREYGAAFAAYATREEAEAAAAESDLLVYGSYGPNPRQIFRVPTGKGPTVLFCGEELLPYLSPISRRARFFSTRTRSSPF